MVLVLPDDLFWRMCPRSFDAIYNRRFPKSRPQVKPKITQEDEKFLLVEMAKLELEEIKQAFGPNTFRPVMGRQAGW